MRTGFSGSGLRRRDALALVTGGGVLLTGTQVGAEAAGGRSLAPIRALVFDTFGTVVDWRASVAAEAQGIAAYHGLQIDAFKVAAHLGDLHAAKALGLATAFVSRPLEFGPDGRPDLMPDASVDLTATNFDDLAARLGA